MCLVGDCSFPVDRVAERDSLFAHRRNQRYLVNPQFHPLVIPFAGSCDDSAAWLNPECLPELAAGIGTLEQLNLFFEACELYCQTGVNFFLDVSLDSVCGQVCDVRSERKVLPDVNGESAVCFSALIKSVVSVLNISLFQTACEGALKCDEERHLLSLAYALMCT